MAEYDSIARKRVGRFFGSGPHWVYHDFGADVITTVYSQDFHAIMPLLVTNWHHGVEVLLPDDILGMVSVVVIG